MRAPLLVVLSLLLAPAISTAQQLDLSLPGNVILPNYARLTVGQEEGLEGGAFIARTNNALANWYNPAGLVQVPTAQLNASATAYEQTNLRLKGLTVGATASRLASIGTFFGGVVGKPILSSDNLRLGFSITTPLQWRPGTITGASQFTSAGKDNDFGTTTEVELSQMIPAIAAGARAGDHVRIGASIGVAITGLTQRQSLVLRQTSVDSVLTIARSSTTDGSSYDAVLSAGMQWDLGTRVTLGANVSSPGLHIMGSSKLTLESGIHSADRYEDVVIRDPKAKFDYRIPARVGAGVGVRFEKAEVEVDVNYHGAVERYVLYESDVRGTYTQLVGGVPSVVNASVVPRRNEWQSVVNVALGGNYRLNEHVRLHGGFYTDHSPVADPNDSFFRQMDLMGYTGGASWKGTRFSGSLGLGYSAGNSGPVRLTDATTGITSETRLEVRSFRAAYALSFIF